MTLLHLLHIIGSTLGTGSNLRSKPLSLDTLPLNFCSGVKSANAAGTMTTSWSMSSSMLIRSETESNLLVLMYSGIGTLQPPIHRSTSAPRSNARVAIFTAIIPVERLVTIRMESMGSSLRPPMTRILLPIISSLDSILNTDAMTSSLEATRALGPTILGPMKVMPNFFSFSTFSCTAGFLNMASCIAGAIAMGTPEPKATVAMDVTVVSSIPLAIFDMVFAVAG